MAKQVIKGTMFGFYCLEFLPLRTEQFRFRITIGKLPLLRSIAIK